MKNVLSVVAVSIPFLCMITVSAQPKNSVDPSGGKKLAGDAVGGEVLNTQEAWVAVSKVTGTKHTEPLNPASINIPAGSYAATTHDTINPDLVESKTLPVTVSLFGVPGTTIKSWGCDHGTWDYIQCMNDCEEAIHIPGPLCTKTCLDRAPAWQAILCNDCIVDGLCE